MPSISTKSLQILEKHSDSDPSRKTLIEAVSGAMKAGGRIDAVYVHVPFCTTKCHYCDFYSVAGHLDQADEYLSALACEIDMWKALTGTLRPQTIFIGGGTPTLLDPQRLQRLLELIGGAVDLAGVEEFTVEANPNTFDVERARTLVGGGVNRISFGAQSFIRSELQMLQRDHEPENVARAVEIAAGTGIANLNVDLIFGIPGQTLDSWEYSLAQSLKLGINHMSCYSLTYEPNTAMTARMKRGEFPPIDEELELAMFEHVYRRMRGAGFERYEVSNYAKPGRECRHNLFYWKGGNWMGWGPSVGAHVNGWRWKNAGSLTHYVEGLNRGELPLTQIEHLSKAAWACEVAAFWLRLSAGLNYAEFLDKTGVEAKPVLERVLKKYADMGLVEFRADNVRIKEEGVVVSNRILRDVVGAF